MEQRRKNILILAGNGQNVGKTLFACRLIEHLSTHHSIIAIKICPHFHDLKEKLEILKESDNLLITREHNSSGHKDSNRLMKAGAKEVYYVQTKDEKLAEMMNFFDAILNKNAPILIESGGLRDLIHPGLFLVLDHKNNTKLKSNTLRFRELSDVNIEFDGEAFDFDPKKLDFSNDQWILKN